MWTVLVALHAAATWYLVGLIWTIQVVHYPSFSSIDPATYSTFQSSHMTRMGAIVGPILTGWAMGTFGATGFWIYLLAVMVGLSAYVAYRMTQRASLYATEDDYDAVSYAPIAPSATVVAVEVAQEVYAENEETGESSDDSSLDRV